VWTIEYYQPETGRFPVVEFIDSLEAKSRAKKGGTIIYPVGGRVHELERAKEKAFERP